MARQPMPRHAISLPCGRVVPAPAMQAVIWRALWRSYPEPVCIGTLARVMWPASDVPPVGWEHSVSSHITKLRRLIAGSEIAIADREGWRYRITISAAGHLQPPQQPDELGQQHGGQQRHQNAVEQRGCSPVARQSVSPSRVALHDREQTTGGRA